MKSLNKFLNLTNRQPIIQAISGTRYSPNLQIEGKKKKQQQENPVPRMPEKPCVPS